MHSHFAELRVEQQRLLSGEHHRRQEIGVVEQRFPTVYRAHVPELFGVGDAPRHHALVRAAVWALLHPGHIHLPKGMAAKYLNLTEAELDKYFFEAQTILIEGASNPAHEDLMTCFQFFGPTVARILSVTGL